MTPRNRLLVPVVLLLLGAVLLWAASRTAWLEVVAFNDQSGEARRTLVGADWQPALVPIALGAVAAVAAVALVRGTGARVVGAVIALLGVAAGAQAASTVGDVDTDRVHAAVTSEEELGRTNAGPGASGVQSLPEWSEITGTATRATGPALTAGGALALLAAGAVVIAWPARAARRDDRYVTPSTRRGEAGAGDAGTGRGLWEELDEGRDPTA
ncbi:TIGR02234 family membrane protein [Dietzia sp. 179-F 9C3 NHS]|uniref:TIGR02234 family membrane protein n=1 Tax=Dietzia sp. 179-F 9C3 NHS TaxID=3374295 RepID=UPI00387A34E6